jgi:uncharacterized protein YfaS (alpha-2-macroglobulin family)
MYKGETVSKQMTFRDKDGVLIDPDTITITIYNPSGASTATPTASKSSTGIWTFDYTLASDAPVGIWVVTVTGVKGTYVKKYAETFTVEALPS